MYKEADEMACGMLDTRGPCVLLDHFLPVSTDVFSPLQIPIAIAVRYTRLAFKTYICRHLLC